MFGAAAPSSVSGPVVVGGSVQLPPQVLAGRWWSVVRRSWPLKC